MNLIFKTQRDKARHPKKARTARVLAILGNLFLALLLTGCASVARPAASDPVQYNATTGYPAVGGPGWGRF